MHVASLSLKVDGSYKIIDLLFNRLGNLHGYALETSLKNYLYNPLRHLIVG